MPRIHPAKEFPSTSPFLPQNPSSSFILEICIHPSIHSSIDGGDGQCSPRKGEFMANVPIMHACYNGYLTLPRYRPDLALPDLASPDLLLPICPSIVHRYKSSFLGVELYIPYHTLPYLTLPALLPNPIQSTLLILLLQIKKKKNKPRPSKPQRRSNPENDCDSYEQLPCLPTTNLWIDKKSTCT